MDLLRHLRYFVVVADEENITAAAQRLGVQQPPLSRALARLEAELGTTLFARGNTGIRLTEAGRLLLPEARQLVAQADALPGYLNQDGRAVRLTVAVPAHLSAATLRELQRRASARCCGAAILARPRAWRERALREATVDVAVVAVADGGVTMPLGLGVDPAHPLARLDAVHPTDLDGVAATVLDEDAGLADTIAAGLTGRGFEGTLLSGAPDGRDDLTRCADGLTTCLCAPGEAADAGLVWHDLGLPARHWSFTGLSPMATELEQDLAVALEVRHAARARR